MLEASMTWILLTVFLAAGNVSSAEVLPGDVCYAGETPNVTDSLAKLPSRCCQEITKECAAANNGQCMFKWLTGTCDYTADVCTSSWFCTCCGSCTEVNTYSKCKRSGGRCSKTCSSTEYHAGWIPCHSGCCKCCMNKCGEKTCANGRGYCSPDGICKTGYYPSTSEFCKGFGCTCCVPCGESKRCALNQGICEWNQRKCPPGYLSTSGLCCPDSNCRCCYKGRLPPTPEMCTA
ncbi:keratin-associated protein 5-5-like [Macrobrachium nipponense]|uniref:keratin-associated protein 5-5-like n=1 Tax=Macrobrachium nipponense TaxID=159736 RepID=UPI0030C81C45